jgi:hypothetical protein
LKKHKHISHVPLTDADERQVIHFEKQGCTGVVFRFPTEPPSYTLLLKDSEFSTVGDFLKSTLPFSFEARKEKSKESALEKVTKFLDR